MATRRYAVIDADGVKINCILVDDAVVDSYWPGYGAKLLDEGPEPEEVKPPPNVKPDDFGVTDVVPDKPMSNGDKIDFKTGVVTKAEVKE